MTQKIDLNKLLWHEKNPPLNNENVWALDKIPFNIPASYIELLNISDGGILENRFFRYLDHNPPPSVFESSIEIIYSLAGGKEDFFNHYYTPLKFLPANLIAFGETGGGSQICFDYKGNAKTEDPPIVYYEDELYTGDDGIIFIANNFEEFLRILY